MPYKRKKEWTAVEIVNRNARLVFILRAKLAQARWEADLAVWTGYYAIYHDPVFYGHRNFGYYKDREITASMEWIFNEEKTD